MFFQSQLITPASFSRYGDLQVLLESNPETFLNLGDQRFASSKGKDRSHESNVPRSNVVFSAIKANHLKVNGPETLFSPL